MRGGLAYRLIHKGAGDALAANRGDHADREDLRLIGGDAEQEEAAAPIQEADDAMHLQLHLKGAGAPGLVGKGGTMDRRSTAACAGPTRSMLTSGLRQDSRWWAKAALRQQGARRIDVERHGGEGRQQVRGPQRARDCNLARMALPGLGHVGRQAERSEGRTQRLGGVPGQGDGRLGERRSSSRATSQASGAPPRWRNRRPWRASSAHQSGRSAASARAATASASATVTPMTGIPAPAARPAAKARLARSSREAAGSDSHGDGVEIGDARAGFGQQIRHHARQKGGVAALPAMLKARDDPA